MTCLRLLSCLSALLAICLTASCSLFRSPEHLSLTESDSGRTFDLRVGDTLLVALPGNATTGYGWYPRHGAGDVQIIAEKGDRYETGISASGVPAAGQGGTYYFAYRVIGPGVCGIALDYKRSWENKEPARTFEVMIRATGKPEEAAADPREEPPEDAPVYMTDSKGNVSIRPDLP